MTEEFKNENPPAPPQAEPDVAALIKRMHQQLIFLEKKIDILISQSQGQGAPPREKYFSKPYRSFDRSHHFEKRHGEENREFGHKRKAYDKPRGSDSGHGGKRGFDPKKKPFYYGHKDRG